MGGGSRGRSVRARARRATGAAFALPRLRRRECARRRLSTAASLFAARGVAQSDGAWFVTTHTEIAGHSRTYARHRRFHGVPRRSPRVDRGRHSSRARHRGVVLPIVLLMSAMMLTTSAVWFETSLAATRAAANVRDYLQALHAADSALTSCARRVVSAAADASVPPQAESGEPV